MSPPPPIVAQPRLIVPTAEQLRELQRLFGFEGSALLVVLPPPAESAVLQEVRGMARTMATMAVSLETVARNQYELRKENEELRQLNKDGYFNFAVRVKGDDFLAFAVIMALGNRKAAADHLKIPHRTLYNRVDQWSARGKEYQLMLRYMEWISEDYNHKFTIEGDEVVITG